MKWQLRPAAAMAGPLGAQAHLPVRDSAAVHTIVWVQMSQQE